MREGMKSKGAPERKREAGACATGEEEGHRGSSGDYGRADHECRRGSELHPRVRRC
jgi:hypothetical protein